MGLGHSSPAFPCSRLLPGSRGQPSPSLEPSLSLFFSSALSAEGRLAEEQDGQKYIFLQLLHSAARVNMPVAAPRLDFSKAHPRAPWRERSCCPMDVASWKRAENACALLFG